jgi:F-type H+-transporting ATPase subunit epsilon
MIDITIMTPKGVLHEGEVETIAIPGDRGDFEILQFHKPIISRLRRGEIVLDWKQRIPVSGGIVRVHRDEVVVLVEQ